MKTANPAAKGEHDAISISRLSLIEAKQLDSLCS